ncbi:MAG: flagellar basal body FlgE domain-containing protein [Thiotrichales bacterium]
MIDTNAIGGLHDTARPSNDTYDIAPRMRRARVEFDAQYQVAMQKATLGRENAHAAAPNLPQLSPYTEGGNNRQPRRQGLDVSLNDGSHYLLNDHGRLTYGRADSFRLDGSGFLSNANGQRLLGHNATEQGYLEGRQSELRIDQNLLPANSTRFAQAALRLDRYAPTATGAFDPNDPSSYNDVTHFRVYDHEGRSHIGQMYLRRLDESTWQSHVYFDGVAMNGAEGDLLQFDAEGSLAAVNNSRYSTTRGLTIDTLGNQTPHTFTIDYAGINARGYNGIEGRVAADGHTYARLAKIDVDGSGLLHGIYSNGVTKVLGKIAMAAPNPNADVAMVSDRELAALSGKGTRGGNVDDGVSSAVKSAIDAQFDYMRYRVKRGGLR